MSLPCVILAGGRGTRMRPITNAIPKALVTVRGRPFAGWQLDLLASEGVREVLYLVGYRASMISDYLGDGADWGVKVDYVDEGDDLKGTGGALRFALDQGRLPPAFFLLYGDSFLPVTLADVAHTWEESSLPALMTVLRNEERWDKSNVILRGGRVELYDKSRPKSRLDEMKWIDYGLSVLSSEVVGARVPPGAAFDLADLMRDLSVDGQLAGLEVSQRFYEVGSPGGLDDLEHYLAEHGSANPGQ
jgi:NDP-sugar pyrophosphorylase family protein